MQLRPGSTPTRDMVEALTILAQPARVTITVGSESHSCDVQAGVGVCTSPLNGSTDHAVVSAMVSRNNTTVSAARSPWPVLATPPVQDLQYTATIGRSAL